MICNNKLHVDQRYELQDSRGQLIAYICPLCLNKKDQTRQLFKKFTGAVWDKIHRRMTLFLAVLTGVCAVWAAVIGATANSLDIELTALFIVVVLVSYFCLLVRSL